MNLHVELFRVEARQFGWSIRQHEDPAAMPVLHALHGWVLLTAGGTWTTHPPNQTTATRGVPA
ncbi:hypothetical protein ACIBCR_14805 [Micromonospora echinospora]|uniref:hypothetical protein n=1 Tax=Micromonospora echinospora TaxID=1877 RepID=UPI0037ABAE57